MFEAQDRSCVRLLGIDDVQQAEHALIDRLLHRVRAPLESVVDERHAEGLGIFVSARKIGNVHALSQSGGRERGGGGVRGAGGASPHFQLGLGLCFVRVAARDMAAVEAVS